MDPDRVRHDARAEHVEHDLLQRDRQGQHPYEDIRRPEERDREDGYLGDDRAEERNDHRESRQHRQHTGERDPEQHEDRESCHPVDQTEDERPTDETAERAVRALPEQLRLAAELGAEGGEEPLPELIAVDQHDERDDEDEGRIEEDVRRRGDVPERIGRDRSRDLGELRRDLAVQVGHAHRETRSFQPPLQGHDLLRGAIAVLGGTDDEVVELTHESRHDERESPCQNERDPDVHDDDAERAIEDRALIDAGHKGREQVRDGPGRDEDDQDVGDARERLGEVSEELKCRENDEKYDERRQELPLPRREIHRRMVLTEYHASPCQTRAALSIATRPIFQ